MKIKDGVYTGVVVMKNGVETNLNPSPQIKQAMDITSIVSREITRIDSVITSIFDGKHKTGSKHFTGNAFDIRTFHYKKAQIGPLVFAMKKKLGPDYDVIFETDHIHIEYDPKNLKSFSV